MYVPTVGLQFLVNAIVNQAIVESAALEVITVVLIDDCLTAWLLDSSNDWLSDSTILFLL